MSGLSFAKLREANTKRLPLFTNGQGQKAHPDNDPNPWTVADWVVALVGEVGELCNNLKKVRRGDFGQGFMRDKIVQEIADVQIYLDLLAKELDIDLGAATKKTFNAKSKQLGLPVFIR